jgi:peptidyl-dipeptidase Dcp
MKLKLFTATAMALALAAGVAGCSSPEAPPRVLSEETTSLFADIPAGTGYFATESTLPFQTPDFTKISDEDFEPAFTESMEIHKAEIAAIKNNPAEANFDNTIVALEVSGAMLSRVATVFFALTGADTNDTLDGIDERVSPALTAHSDAINLDADLFARVKAVYDAKDSLDLNTEDTTLLERTYDDMVHAGALLTAEQKEEVKKINTRLSETTTKFGTTVREATVAHALVEDTREELAGLSDSDMEHASTAAADRGLAGKFVIPLQNTTQQPLLPELENREIREKMFKLSYNRADQPGDNDTRLLLAEIASLRAQKAALFGQPDWASYTMYDRMAKTPQTALDFMGQMVEPLADTQRREAGMLNEQIKKDGGDFTVQPWDWYRYANQVRKEKYDLDESLVTPYFQIDSVLENGVFFAATELYGITFEKRDDLPVYHEDVTTYTVKDADGTELALFYFDPYQRPSKRGGAWMSTFVDQAHMYGTKPVIYNVLNIPKAAEGEPQLVSFDNVNTLFHEFGHALHGMFADQNYRSISGTATARDFVEYPSQVNEMWATYPAILSNYAKHHETGETIPTELIEKIEAAAKFNQGYDFGEVVEAALLDMKWHALSPEEAAAIDTPEKVDAFERNSLESLGLEIDLVPSRYRSTYFNHIFSSPAGYSSGYYSYLWTEMLDRDSRKWFMDNGGLTRENGDHYRAEVLSRGGTMDYFEMFDNFAGREPNVDPMLEARGLTGEGE